MKFDRFMQTSSLMGLHRNYHIHFDPLVKDLHQYSMGLQEALVLLALFFETPQPVSPTDLHHCLSLPRDKVSQALQALHRKDFIRRELDPQDQRKRLVVLSALGKKTASRLVAIFDRYEQRLDKDLNQTHGHTLTKTTL